MPNQNTAESMASVSAPIGGETLQLAVEPRAAEPTRGDSFSFLHAAPMPKLAASLPSVPGYELLRVLGRGGMGVVYLARQVQLDRLVALKMILGDVDARPEDRERFHAEAQAIARLQHPNIVQLYDLGECEGRPYFSLEYVAGGNLAEFMAGQPRPPREAAELVQTLARAVHYAHEQGIVHRDLKPANILLTAPSSQSSALQPGRACVLGPLANLHVSPGAAKIGDFGLARLMHRDSRLTQTGDVIGTPSYMAPEQAHGRTVDLGPRVDIYALGAILYEMLTGRPPFQGVTPMETILLLTTCEPASPSVFQPRLPRDLVTICLKCLQKEPERRYSTAADLADDLCRFLEDRPILARPVTGMEKVHRWSRRNPALAGTLAVLLLVVLAGMAAVTGLWLYAERKRGEAEANAHKAGEALDLAHQREKETRMANEVAERNLRRALSTVDQTLVKLAEMQQAQLPQFEPERTALLEGALAILTETLKENPSSTAARRQAMEVSRRVAEINRQLCRLPECEAAFATGLEIARQLVREQPESLEARISLIRLLSGVAAFQAKQFRPDQAIQLQQEALRESELAQTLAGEGGFGPADVAHAKHLLGQYYLGAGQIREALSCLRQAVAEMEAILASDSKSPCRDMLPNALANLARCLGEVGQQQEGEEKFRAALAMAEQQLSEMPHDFASKYRAAALSGDLGTYLSFTPEPLRALPCFQRSEQLFHELATDRPLRPDLRSAVSRALMNSAVVNFSHGDLDAARKSCQDAISINEKLCQAYPLVVEYAANKVRGMHLYASAQSRQRDLQGALKTLDRAMHAASEQAERFSTSPEIAMMPAVVKISIAEITAATGNLHEASNLAAEASALVLSLRSRFPEDGIVRAQCDQIDQAVQKIAEFKRKKAGG